MASYITTLNNIQNMQSNLLNIEYDIKTTTDIVNSLPIYVLNPKQLKNRYDHMMYQFKESNINTSNINWIEPTPYPNINGDKKRLYNDIISRDHIRMWNIAYEYIQKTNSKGALFFEDDVYFLKNWKQLLETILKKYDNDANIIRFDSYPYISISDNLDKIAITNSLAFACMGGYYLSRDAIITSLTFIKTNKWEWNTIEDILHMITSKYFKNMSFETIPRLAVQNWILHNKSNLQTDEHMDKVRKTQIKYFKRYYQKYIIENQNELENALINAYDDYIEKNL